MGRRWDEFRSSVTQHGLGWTLLRYADAQLGRLVRHELCLVIANDEAYGVGSELDDHETRAMHVEEKT